jgi:hypothetical protein
MACQALRIAIEYATCMQSRRQVSEVPDETKSSSLNPDSPDRANLSSLVGSEQICGRYGRFFRWKNCLWRSSYPYRHSEGAYILSVPLERRASKKTEAVNPMIAVVPGWLVRC